MATPVSLKKVTKKIRCSDGPLAKVKELIECEMRLIPLFELTMAEIVDDFLNSLFTVQGEYSAFVKEFPVFFLLKSATLNQPLPIQVDAQLVRVLEVTKVTLTRSAEQTPVQDDESLEMISKSISNLQILEELEIFINLLSSLLDMPPSEMLFPHFPKTLSTFRFAEEIIHSLYSAFWASHSPNMVKGLDMTTSTPTLEDFLVLNFRIRESLYPLDELGGAKETLSQRARQILDQRKNLFITADSFTSETFLTLPVSKQRSRELLDAVGKRGALEGDLGGVNNQDSKASQLKPENNADLSEISDTLTSDTRILPVLSFQDSDLSHATIGRLFFYDFVIEALGRGEAYLCDRDVVDTFMGKGIQFMLTLIESILRLSNPTLGVASRSPTSSFSTAPFPPLSPVREPDYTVPLSQIREQLILCGLSTRSCTTFRTILSLTPPPNNIPWVNYRDFFHLVNQLTLFGHQFYCLLSDYSTTSISINLLKRKIPQVVAQFTDGIVGKTGILADLPTSDTGLVTAFRVFQRSIPEDTLTSIFLAIPYPVVRLTTSILIKRQWGLRLSADITMKSTTPTKDKVVPSSRPPSLKQVEKYCRDLEVGSMVYDITFVWSEFFPQVFVTTIIRPTIDSILSNKYQKNRALFLLRWLSTFAADTNNTLDPLRGNLAELYFLIRDILDENQETVVFSDLLDTVRDIYHHFSKFEADDVPFLPIPTTLIEVLFNRQYRGSAGALMDSIQNFVSESKVILDGLTHMVALGDVLCHRVYDYELGTGLIRVPIKGGDTKVLTVNVFKTLIVNLEKTLREGLSVFNQLRTEVNQSYLILLQILSQLDGLSAHAVKIQSLNPDFQLLHKQYIQLFDRVKRVVTLITESCSYSLSTHFSSLFSPSLIQTETVRHILEFQRGVQDTSTLLASLGQPLLERGLPVDTSPSDPLSQNYLDQIEELVNLGAETDSPIKVEYSPNLNVKSAILIDWEDFKSLQYLSEDTDLSFKLLTPNEILTRLLHPVIKNEP